MFLLFVKLTWYFNIHNHKANPSLVLVTPRAMGIPYILSVYDSSLNVGEGGSSRKRSEDWMGMSTGTGKESTSERKDRTTQKAQ